MVATRITSKQQPELYKAAEHLFPNYPPTVIRAKPTPNNGYIILYCEGDRPEYYSAKSKDEIADFVLEKSTTEL